MASPKVKNDTPIFTPVGNPEEVVYRNSAKGPYLLEAIQPIVDEAMANDLVSNWYSMNGESKTAIRSAAKRHNLSVNFGTLNGQPVFKINGEYQTRERKPKSKTEPTV